MHTYCMPLFCEATQTCTHNSRLRSWVSSSLQTTTEAESRGGGNRDADMKEVSNVALARHPMHDANIVEPFTAQQASQFEFPN